MSHSLRPHGLQHARPPCPSPTPGVYPNSCPLTWVIPSNYPILCHPLLLLPPIFPSIRVFSNESVLHTRWPKYWHFSFSISPSNEYSGLISFTIDWLDLLAIQGTLKSLLQHHSSKASILQHSAFFIVQLSHQYMTTDVCAKCLISKAENQHRNWSKSKCLGPAMLMVVGVGAGVGIC